MNDRDRIHLQTSIVEMPPSNAWDILQALVDQFDPIVLVAAVLDMGLKKTVKQRDPEEMMRLWPLLNAMEDKP